MLSIVFFLLTATSGSCKEALDSVFSALRRNDLAKASAILKTVSEACAQSSSFYELQGVTTDLSGDSVSAEHAFEKAVSLQPKEPRLLAELGATYLKNRKLTNAADVLSKAFTLDPSSVAIAQYLVGAYVGLNRWEDAIQVFDRIGAGSKPGVLSQPVMIVWFARALVETKRFREVDALLSPLQPGVTPSVLFSLGELFAQHRMYTQVVSCLTQIPAQDADDAVNFNLGLAYSHLQQFDQARRCYFQAIDKHPEHVNAYLHVGLDYASLGDSRRAVPWVARAHEFAPDRPDIAYALTEQLLQLDYLKSAEEVLTSAMTTNPSDPLLLVGEGDVKAAQGQPAAAADFYLKALVQQSGFVAALVGLARANISQDKGDEARTLLQRALSTDPDNPAANGALGLMELRQGDWDSAVTHLRSSWEKDHSNSEVVLGLANACSRANRPTDALHMLSAVDPGIRNSARFHLALSRVYSQLQRTAEAKKEEDAFKALQTSRQGALRFEKPQSYVF